ncbi:MAG: hypothetical protein U0J70_00805 [Atopobiaceae bacterium]|nr:hypothetical protein [Atopobiaceae bacterium]
MKEGLVVSVSWLLLKRAMLATLPILGVKDPRAFYKKARVAMSWAVWLIGPPYETAASLEERLRSRYAQVHVETHKAMACFTCVK